MEHVVQSLVSAGAFQGKDVQGLHDDTDDAVVSFLAGADGAGIGIGDVMEPLDILALERSSKYPQNFRGRGNSSLL